MFQRYDIQDPLDLKQAAEAMDRWVESTRSHSPAKYLADNGSGETFSIALKRSN